jgi:hypothetical protein
MGFGWMLMLLGLPFLAGVAGEDENLLSQTNDTNAAPGGLTDQADDLSDDMPLVIAFEDTSMPHTHANGCGHSFQDTTMDVIDDDPVDKDALAQTFTAQNAEDTSALAPKQEKSDWLNINNAAHICYGCHDCHVQVT